MKASKNKSIKLVLKKLTIFELKNMHLVNGRGMMIPTELPTFTDTSKNCNPNGSNGI